MSSNQSYASIDGRLDAPDATIQYPTLLDSYTYKPAWHVAGVNYAVGPDVAYSAAYLDPATISGTGLTVNGSTKTLTVSASTAGSRTFTGYDFTNWTIYFTGTGSNTLSLQHCKFYVGANNYKPIYCDVNAGNLTVQYCDIDGAQNTSIGSFALITFPSGNNIIEYCRLQNITFDGIKYGAVSSMLGRYNLFDVMGFGSSPHMDCFQLQNSPVSNIDLSFNTCYHTVAGTAFNSFARIASVSVADITAPVIAYNTIILLGPGVSNAIQIRGSDVVGGSITDPYVHHNYIDYTGADGSSGKAIAVIADTSTITGDVVTDNINMITGATIAKNA